MWLVQNKISTCTQHLVARVSFCQISLFCRSLPNDVGNSNYLLYYAAFVIDWFAVKHNNEDPL